MNSISNGLYALDKSGKPCKKWVKKPTQFKTFSGFKVKYISWKHKNPEKSQKSKIKEEAKAAIKQESSPPMSISATPDLRSEA
jgi:INO80 complex subunit Ies4.